MTRIHRYLPALILFAALFFPNQRSFAQDDTIAIIVHPDNPIDTLSIGEVKEIFLKQKGRKWKQGHDNVEPAICIGKAREYLIFLKEVLHMSPADFDRYWIKIRYQKAEKPPRRLKTEEEVLDFISKNKGGISYVNISTLGENGKSSPNVKTVLRVRLKK